MWQYEILQSQHRINDNQHIDDNVMHASVCFESFGERYDNKECEIQTTNIHSLAFRDTSEGMKVRRMTLRSLECT